MPRFRTVVCALFLLAVIGGASLIGAAPAQADNCQPEEIVVRMIPGSQPGWESPLADGSDPRCVYAAYVGCPNQADPAGCAGGVANYQEWLLGCESRANPTGFCAPPLILP